MVEREKLLVFAKFFACPYVLNLDAVKPFTKDVRIILVGSLATGVNHEQSNVDLCILCKRKVAAEIDKEIHWTGNNCTELTIDGVRTRYYIAELETVLNELNNHDDMAYYLYANAIALDDAAQKAAYIPPIAQKTSGNCRIFGKCKRSSWTHDTGN